MEIDELELGVLGRGAHAGGRGEEVAVGLELAHPEGCSAFAGKSVDVLRGHEADRGGPAGG